MKQNNKPITEIESISGPALSISPSSDDQVTVCALYKFVTLDDYQALRPSFIEQLDRLSIRGTLLLANEGINGTIAGKNGNIKEFIAWLSTDSRFEQIDYKLSYHSEPPFHRTKVKLKKEIVTMGVSGIDPNEVVGTYVEASEWNRIISDPETVLIDTRNNYEVGIGSFKNAVDPDTNTFREFPEYVQQTLDPKKHKKVAMFCTGGIRCEKASAYMKQQGFEEVYHLRGGILKYLETVKEQESLWEGECFVFDDRVAVNQNLDKGQHDQCHACRFPITKNEKESKFYIPGVSCPRCYDTLSQEQIARFEEREKQVQLAKMRGETHIGSDSRLAAKKHYRQKQENKTRQRKNISVKMPE